MLISRNGRIDKTVDAHRGAILAARWSHSGNDLLTGQNISQRQFNLD